MSERKGYNTKNKTIIKEIFRKNAGKELSSREMIELTAGKIGEASVYRLLNSLADEGVISRRQTAAGALYSYDECGCGFHLHCVECGEIAHINCDRMRDARTHIIKEHGFIPISDTTVIDGFCEKCIAEKAGRKS